MSKCHDKHPRAGLVQTHAQLPDDGAFMAVVSCDRPECIRAWKAAIRSQTGLVSFFNPDPQPEGSR